MNDMLTNIKGLIMTSLLFWMINFIPFF